MKLRPQYNRFRVGTSRCDVPDREVAGGLLAPLNAARTARRAVPTTEAQRGVALVITLILLAVITTLAIAFLALTHRETGSVDAMSRTTDAELAVESALERAKDQIKAGYPVHNFNLIANPPVSPDILGPEMLVSVCWETNRLVPTNHLDGSVPVFVDINRPGQPGPPLPLDDRFFLDLNRNGYFEETGVVRDLETGPFGTNANNWRIGDPQWIGVLQDPRRPHTNDNRYVARYAFMVLPAGRSLDLNWIHNDAKRIPDPVAGESWYCRNEGVGGFEVNLAAFLCDLNNNAWNNPNAPYNASPYNHVTTFGFPSTGTAFQDAWQLLRSRYNLSKVNGNRLDLLLSPTPLGSVEAILRDDLIDVYGNGRLDWRDAATWPWPGTDSQRHLFSLHDYFDDQKIPRLAPRPQWSFGDRLINVARNGNSYDRYTFYRMLAQMGTDSVPESDEDEGKININYMNVHSWANPAIRLRASDLVPWATNSAVVSVPRFVGGAVDMGRVGPELFFLSVVTNLLTREYPQMRLATGDPVQPLRIPVFTNGSRFLFTNALIVGPLYSARIHQILQQAANIFDATRTPLAGENPMYPTAFRPRYARDGAGNVFIVDYRMVTEQPFEIMSFNNNPSRQWVDLDLDGGRAGMMFSGGISDNGIYNIPLIIGARRGYPNFNEVASRTMAFAVRRLLALKNPGETDINRFRFVQTLSVAITNEFAMEAWNSYRTSYPRRLEYYYSNEVTVGISSVYQGNARVYPTASVGTNYLVPSVNANAWRGRVFSNSPVATRVVFFTNYVSPVSPGGTLDRWDVTVTNRLRFFLVDNGRIVDAVAFSATNALFDVGTNLVEDFPGTTLALQKLWSPFTVPGRPWNLGVDSQIRISRGQASVGIDWVNYGGFISNKDDSIRAFNDFVDSASATSNDVPFVTVRLLLQTNSWRVNDPLVHHTLGDLATTSAAETVFPRSKLQSFSVGGINNGRYLPWPQDQIFVSPGGVEADPTLRDPSIQSSDEWDFPATRFPNIGWLGKVHRGTPWQTIYFKSAPADFGKWRAVAGPLLSDLDLVAIHPTNDWRLLDIFTTTVHPNVSRGRLSINQTNLAAWSAVLGGVVTSLVTNDTSIDTSVDRPVRRTNEVIYPAAASSYGDVAAIVESINAVRQGRPNRQFTKLSEILAVPALSDGSPFLTNQLRSTGFNSLQPPDQMNVFDSDYERIPQQISSLLKVGEPRFVIYAWGQSLKPARNGVVVNPNKTLSLSGPSIDPGTKICNNYQVTGEAATRAVVRVVFPEKLRQPEVGPAHPLYLTPDYRKPRLVVESFNVIPVE